MEKITLNNGSEIIFDDRSQVAAIVRGDSSHSFFIDHEMTENQILNRAANQISLWIDESNKYMELRLRPERQSYGSHIKGEGGDISLLRDMETNELAGITLPLTHNRLSIGIRGGTIVDITRYQNDGEQLTCDNLADISRDPDFIASLLTYAAELNKFGSDGIASLSIITQKYDLKSLCQLCVEAANYINAFVAELQACHDLIKHLADTEQCETGPDLRMPLDSLVSSVISEYQNKIAELEERVNPLPKPNSPSQEQQARAWMLVVAALVEIGVNRPHAFIPCQMPYGERCAIFIRELGIQLKQLELERDELAKWKNCVIDELVCNWAYDSSHDDNPRKAIHAAIKRQLDQERDELKLEVEALKAKLTKYEQ